MLRKCIETVKLKSHASIVYNTLRILYCSFITRSDGYSCRLIFPDIFLQRRYERVPFIFFSIFTRIFSSRFFFYSHSIRSNEDALLFVRMEKRSYFHGKRGSINIY